MHSSKFAVNWFVLFYNRYFYFGKKISVFVIVQVLAGTRDPASESSCHFVSTSFHDEFLADMMQSHMVKDFCIIGLRVLYTMVPCLIVIVISMIIG